VSDDQKDRRSNRLRIVKTHFGVVQNVPKDLRRCPSPDSGPGRWLNQRLSIRQNIVHFPGQPIVSRIVLVAAETVRSAQPPTSRNYHRVACTSRTEQSRYPIPSAPDLGRYGIGSSIGEKAESTWGRHHYDSRECAIYPLEILFAREAVRTSVVAPVWIWYRLVRALAGLACTSRMNHAGAHRYRLERLEKTAT